MQRRPSWPLALRLLLDATMIFVETKRCKLTRDIAQDGVLTYDDVELPPGRLADQLRAEQYRHFRGETWLEERIQGVEVAGAAPRG